MDARDRRSLGAAIRRLDDNQPASAVKPDKPIATNL
jgi:hypothetical protein